MSRRIAYLCGIMKHSRLAKPFRVYDAQNPKYGVTIPAGDETEAILSARERYPALAHATRVVAVAA